jgi:TolB protein
MSKLIYKNLFILVCFNFVLFFSLQNKAFAEIDTIEIITDINNGRPIAIVPFRYQGSIPLPEDISQIVNNDLRRSGRFNPTPLADLPQRPYLSSQVEIEDWKKIGVEAVLVGEITAIDNQTFRVSFELLDIFSTTQTKTESRVVNGELFVGGSSNSHILESREADVNEKSLRRYSHRIADLVYEKLTGVRGAFSTRLAYVAIDHSQPKPYQLVVSDADGYNPTSLLLSQEPLMSPAWSPDGKQLAYVSFESKRSQIFIQNVFSGERRVVAGFPGINGAPAWSPDGRRLAMTLSKDGNPEIYIMNIATEKFTRLTRRSSIDTEPSWHPNGQTVIFTSNRGGKPQIYQVKLSGGNPKRLTFEGNYNAGASFTADGKFLAVVHRETDTFHISVLDLTTRLFSSLTETRLDESASIAPNGSMIIYATLSRGKKVLAAVSTDGRFRAILPASQGEIRAPAWSPFLN